MANYSNSSSDHFLNADNFEAVLEQLGDALKAGLEFKARREVTNLTGWPESGYSLLEPLPLEGTNISTLLDVIQRDILEGSINFSSNGYLGFPDACNSIAAIAGAIISDVAPQNLVNSRRWAPLATFVEAATVNWLRELIGYKVVESPQSSIDIGGFATTGGVLSNALAVLIARANLIPGFALSGTRGNKILRIIIPNHIDHYSIRTSVNWLGMGTDSIVRAPVVGYRYDLNELKRMVSAFVKGDEAVIVVAYAGDSRSLSIDNLDAIADICEQYGAWLHIDACHGFQLAFSESLSVKLSGLARAHSTTADAHKVLWVPHSLSYLLVRDPNFLKPVVGASDLVTTESMSLGALTPFIGTKRFDSLKLWALIKHLGASNIGSYIELRHQLACEFFELLRDNPRFIVISDEVDINGVIFMHLGNVNISDVTLDNDLIEYLNVHNLQIHDQLMERGKYYLHTFSIPDITNRFGDVARMLQPLRFMSGNVNHSRSDLIGLIAEISHIAEIMA
ncbi:pyridoxal-dependent decarboxylase [Rhizobium sp. ZPR3]|uniref:Pyridoxal-dependent decarboxylase n=2 Tax=unclassified Rhizobium TaxID=2613769 RepID=A0AAU7SRW0_9HYPH